MKKNKIHFDLAISFWGGVAIISIINIALYLLHKNQLVYNLYILGVSIIVLIIFTIILTKRLKEKRKEVRHSSQNLKVGVSSPWM